MIIKAFVKKGQVVVDRNLPAKPTDQSETLTLVLLCYFCFSYHVLDPVYIFILIIVISSILTFTLLTFINKQ